MAQYNDIQISKWNESVPSSVRYLVETKSKIGFIVETEANIILRNLEPRSELIEFYLK